MTGMPNPVREDAGWRFDLVDVPVAYICVDYHRKGKKGPKSKWHRGITLADECSCFLVSYGAPWMDGNFAFYIDPQGQRRQLGQAGEIIARFEGPQGARDYWHGHPMAIDHNRGDVVPKGILRIWFDNGRVSKVERDRLAGLR